MFQVTIGSLSYNLVPFPLAPGIASGELGMSDTVAASESPYTLQTQTQVFPGGDRWDMTLTPPVLTAAQAADWEGFLGELHGILNVFQAADPRRLSPLGSTNGTDHAVCTGVDAAMATQLHTSGWRPGFGRLLLRGDRFQLGYRYHMVCETVNADASGDATLQIYPSLREAPAAGAQLVFNNPQCLLRLASNRRSSQFEVTRLSRTSVRAIEVR